MNAAVTSGTRRATGSCLCGAVRFAINGKLRDVVNCHCGQCRRTHGAFGPYSSVGSGGLEFIEQRGLKWFESSSIARRGFCCECGSSLFWEPAGKDHIAVSAGSLDQPSGLSTVGHIFTDEQGDFYSIDDGLERWPGTMAASAPKEDV